MGALIFTGALAAVVGCITFIPALYERVFHTWYKKWGIRLREKYRCINVRSSPEESMKDDLSKRLKTIWKVILLGTLMGLFAVVFEDGGEIIESIVRPAFGEGETQVELVAEHDGKEEVVALTVDEKNPDEEELEDFFSSACEEALGEVLGDNEDFSCVTKSLNLITSLNGGIEITWQISDPEVISYLGEPGDDIPEEGAEVSLIMKMTYEDYSRSFEISVTVWPDEDDEDTAEGLEAYLNDALAEDADELEASLPTEYEGSALTFRRQTENIWQNLALLSLLAALVIAVRGEGRLEEDFKKRNISLEQDYPDIVSRLSILFAAGLTIPAAWERLAADYERELARKKKMRSGYEELRLTALKLTNTGYSDQLFSDFGRRCGDSRYMRLADILEQSMKKGTVQLTTFMEQEALQAFELKKQHALKLGEEAGTKLLGPMMIMFGLVIAMVVVPAWTGMSL